MNIELSFISSDGTVVKFSVPQNYSDVSLKSSDGTGVKTLLDGVSWERAFQELISADSSHDTTIYMIIDNDTRELALMVPAKSLRCSRTELVQRLCQARELYEFRVEANVFRPAVEVI